MLLHLQPPLPLHTNQVHLHPLEARYPDPCSDTVNVTSQQDATLVSAGVVERGCEEGVVFLFGGLLLLHSESL